MRTSQGLAAAEDIMPIGGDPALPMASLNRPSLATAGRAPVFLHSSFRTGSTWLWSKIRRAPTTLAYYEIFNEALATMTRAQISKIDVSGWDTRHPITAAYFLEFLPPLSAEGGIAGIDRQGSLDGFIPQHGPDGDLEASDKAYVERLIAEARALHRIPVLSCTRSLGRARALRSVFGGKTIVLYRNLFHQWASYCWQRENGNSYFMNTIRICLDAAKHDPFLASIAACYELTEAPLPDDTAFQNILTFASLFVQYCVRYGRYGD